MQKKLFPTLLIAAMLNIAAVQADTPTCEKFGVVGKKCVYKSRPPLPGTCQPCGSSYEKSTTLICNATPEKLWTGVCGKKIN